MYYRARRLLEKNNRRESRLQLARGHPYPCSVSKCRKGIHSDRHSIDQRSQTNNMTEKEECTRDSLVLALSAMTKPITRFITFSGREKSKGCAVGKGLVRSDLQINLAASSNHIVIPHRYTIVLPLLRHTPPCNPFLF